MKEDKFKVGDIVIFKNYFDSNSREWDNIGFVPMYNKLIIGKKYKISSYADNNNSVKIGELNHFNFPADSFELYEESKLNLVIAKLKQDLLNQDLTIKTNNEQRIMLKAICQELDIAHYTLVYPHYNNTVDIDNTYEILYTTWTEGNPDTLFYGTEINSHKTLINFEDLVEGFNQFKNKK